MPTFSDAISDNDFTNPQTKPVATPPRRPNRPKEFWEAEPEDREVQGWKDDPVDPTGPQLGSIANPTRQEQAAQPTPPRPFNKEEPKVVITPDNVTKTRSDNPKWTEYVKFADAVTSDASKNGSAFIARTAELQAQGCKLERLLTAAVGLSAESGEFLEIVKKIAFQGKPYDDANRRHLAIELGDVLWYVAQACIALDLSLDDVLAKNIEKLSARYPEGHFNSYFSENRRIDDL